MTTYPDALQAAITAPMTFAAVRERILADETLPLVRRRDTASALTCLAKALGLPPDILLADPVDLRARLKGLEPAMVRIKPARWKNILSLTRAALTHVGICRMPTRFEGDPSAAWTRCLNLLLRDDSRFRGDEKDQNRFLLGRFARYCTLIGIEPEQVDDAVLARFREDLRLRSLVDNYDRAARDTAVRWNRVAEAVPGWPQQRLTVADNRNHYSLPDDAFPPSLIAEEAAWLEHLAQGSDVDVEDEDFFEPMAPVSIQLWRKSLRLYRSALVLKGEDPTNLVDMASLVTPARITLAVAFFRERQGQERSMHMAQILSTLLACARHWIKAPPPTIRALRNALRRVRPENVGSMTERNETLLTQLDDRQRLLSLLRLPPSILAEAARRTPDLRTARQVQTAVMIEILLKAPLRMKNLTGIKIGTNLQPQSNGDMRLFFPATAVKNSQPIDVRLRGTTVRLLERYLTVDRPLLAQPGSPYLFPGQTADRSKTQLGVRSAIQTMIAKRCGLKFHPHLFRHMAGRLIIDDRIEATPIVQRVLGHKRITTTDGFYLSRKSHAAFAHLDGLVENLRQDETAPKRRKTRRKGG